MSKFIAALAILNTAVLAFLFWLVWNNSSYTVDEIWKLRSTMRDVQGEVEAIKGYISANEKYIDFTVSSIQEIDDSFYLARAEQEAHLTGIKFRGRVINATALDHENVKFRITSADKTKEFSINRISSGNSTGFEVYIPDLAPKDARYAQINYLSSTVSFLVK